MQHGFVRQLFGPLSSLLNKLLRPAFRNQLLRHYLRVVCLTTTKKTPKTSTVLSKVPNVYKIRYIRCERQSDSGINARSILKIKSTAVWQPYISSLWLQVTVSSYIKSSSCCQVQFHRIHTVRHVQMYTWNTRKLQRSGSSPIGPSVWLKNSDIQITSQPIYIFRRLGGGQGLIFLTQ